MTKFLVFNTTFLPHQGGIDNYINNLIKYTDHNVKVICFIKENNDEDGIISIFEYFKIPTKLGGILLRFDLITSIIVLVYFYLNKNKLNSDILLVRHPVFYPLVYFNKKIAFVIATILPDYMATALKDASFIRKIYLSLRILFFKYAEKKLVKHSNVFTLSNNMKNEVLKNYKEVLKNEVIVSYPGINRDRFTYSLKEINRKQIDLVTVCRLSKEKNIELILKAISENPNLFLTIVGDGPNKKKLVNMVDELKIQKKVKFEGFSNKVEVFLKNADIFVLPSTYEGFGHVYLEAMATGKPCIALDASFGYKVASNEIIKPLYNGELINNNSNSLSNAINKITCSDEIYAEYSLNALNFSEKFNWNNHLEKIEKSISKERE
ncbi:glycosyltransferase family 4 protein [Planococcus halotolerans]|uniref:Glycosyl transferase family 1 domain-containing protein n=1 Tax=Planococcus halotolerans TaxID=2233542 RepID=A0A365L5R2_9BACL|nr:glycosyltransferase family 4 protein [Planococcus halotolerans]RAZ80715.1 hypothetical protein DP120_00025 [Planococcus halotolerans]